LTLVPGHDVDLVDLHLSLQPHGRGLGDQAAAELLRHGLHIRPIEAQLLGDLPVREIQTHEVQAQDPHPQRLMVSGQHGAGQVVEASRARLAAVALPVGLAVVASVPNHAGPAAGGTAYPLRPTVLAHQGEALGVVDQRREVDQVRCGHDARGSSHRPVGYPVPLPPSQKPYRPATQSRAITPDPNKSHEKYRCESFDHAETRRVWWNGR
jgi:hypothetical protein